MLTRFIFEEDGQTLVEYGLLLSLLALVVVGAVTLFGGGVRNNIGNSSNRIANATGG